MVGGVAVPHACSCMAVVCHQADWTDLDFAEEKRSYYFISKTLAEKYVMTAHVAAICGGYLCAHAVALLRPGRLGPSQRRTDARSSWW